ncbi:hypothetical protein BJX61DRAFT_505027 [Aspergillus egyptiacus]|nr:hypothetical protein BJX61DRAFT_505027 [Aspergillus egyptiacus]
MKWESFVLLVTAAGSAMAAAHGMHKDTDVHRRRDAAGIARRDEAATTVVWITKTVTDVDIVTVYTTLTVDPTTSITTSSEVTETSTIAHTSSVLVSSVDTSSTVSTPTPTSTTTTTTASENTSTTTSTSTVPPSSSTPSSDSPNWTSTPSVFSTTGFGARTTPSSASPSTSNARLNSISYTGNVGLPWGSNIITVSSLSAWTYKYVAQFTLPTSTTSNWFVSIWNKAGPSGKLDGWYGLSALNFTISPGETVYVAFDENSQGGWGAAPGDSLPVDQYGGYACTWGEFDFGDEENGGWSGWDVSAIQAQNAGLEVQGMRICSAAAAAKDGKDDKECSYVTAGAGEVHNGYTASQADVDGIGGSVEGGAVRLVVELDYA